jgi:3-phosphoshikimate 1-carboxyvinyltransferase
MTVSMLRSAGAGVDTADNTWLVHPGPLTAGTVVVEPDLSGAAPFLAAAAVTGGRVTISGWPATTTQPGAALPDLLARMGATVVHSADRLSLTGTDELVGIDVDLHDHGELAPVVAAVAALANGPSQLRGIAHLRRHETDRLAALATELGRLGGAARETDDGLVITPQPLHGGRFATYDDHRLVMAAAVLALVIDDIVVGDVITVAKTMPDFTERWDRMLAGTD